MTRRLAAGALALGLTAALLSSAPTASADPEPVAGRTTTTPSGFRHLDRSALGKVSGLPSGLSADRKVSALVELETQPVAAQRTRSTGTFDQAAAQRRVRASQDGAAAAVDAAGGTVYGRLGTAINALQVRVRVRDLPAVAAAAGVRRVQVSRTVHLTNSASNAYTRADRAWESLGLTGQGQTIGIIDTGIDYTHADFGGPGTEAAFKANDGTVVEPGTFPTAKVVGGYDLVGDDYDAASTDEARLIPKPDPDPLDCEGHGTHVAGTAAGSGVTTDGRPYAGPYTRSTTATDFSVEPGAAPAASLRAYRVFGCEGSVSDDVIVAAIDRAVADGVNVINMSLGSDFGTADGAESVAVGNATKAGVLVVTSAGNSGSGPYVVGGPSTADDALSVAATDDEFATYPGVAITGAATATGLVANGVTVPAGLSGTVLDAGLGCEAGDYTGAAGKVVVTLRGTCDRVLRAKLGQAAGAKAVIMVNSDAGLPPYEGPIDGVTIPFVGVPSSAGAALRAAAGSSVTLTPSTVSNPTYGQTADFSSNGPRFGDSAQKPDVSAPGVSVPSAAVGTGTGAITESGTSMASPETAGIAALVRQSHPGWSARQVKAVVMATASPSRVAGYDSRRNGTGEVDALAATQAQTYTSTGSGLNSLRFGSDQLSGSRSERQTFTLTNQSKKSVTYRLKATFSGSRHGASVSLSPSKVTLKPGKSRSVGVTLKLSKTDVRNLPGSSASDAGELSTIRGRIVASSSSSSAARPDLQTTFLSVPVPLSDVRSSTTVKATSGGGLSPISVKNQGVHSGDASVFSWLLTDPAGDASAKPMPDLTDVGLAVLPGEDGGSTAADRLLIFSVSEAYALSTQSYGETDLLLDVDADGTADYVLVGLDAGLLGVGSAGTAASALVDLASNEIVDAFIASAPANGSTLELPVLASDLGLTGSSLVGVSAVSFSLGGDGVDPVDGTATFDPYAPALSSGSSVTLKPGAKASLPVTADARAFATQTHLGWLVVTPDDRAGQAEADRVTLVGVDDASATTARPATAALRRP